MSLTYPTYFPNGVEAPIKASELEVTGVFVIGALPTSALNKITTLEKADSYALADGEKTLGVSVTMTAGSKVLTLELESGQSIYVKNAGATNAFSVKNIAADDTGAFTLGVGETALVCGGSATKNTFTYMILYATPAAG
jgi:hypothetical protein